MFERTDFSPSLSNPEGQTASGLRYEWVSNLEMIRLQVGGESISISYAELSEVHRWATACLRMDDGVFL